MTSDRLSTPSDQRRMMNILPDGTVKMVNPFSGSESWVVPGHGEKAIFVGRPKSARKIEKREFEDYCPLCEAHYQKTPPERARLVKKRGKFARRDHLPPGETLAEPADFRRVPTLSSVITLEYWRNNYGYELSPENQAWKERYLADAAGFKHVREIVAQRWRDLGRGEKEIQRLDRDAVHAEADRLFGGGHELVVARRHFDDDAEFDCDLVASGSLTPDDHFAYLTLTVDALKNIHDNNRYVRYVAVFQNWLAAAGAETLHLHKQLVSLDEWGSLLEREVAMARSHPNVHNELAVNFAGYSNTVIAENGHAIAVADIGHWHPTIAVWSKSRAGRPQDLSPDELRGFSDLLHACHAAATNRVPCNEEWYYQPVDCLTRIPFRALIKWRINTPVGFEAGTRIFINPLSPREVRDKMIARFETVRKEGRVAADIAVGRECEVKPNCLLYCQ
ncbi:MAG: DUF4921 family protein [Planctomycetes bacterium]|nr:DUF4921 family protein [Planctomycetota bacterium]